MPLCEAHRDGTALVYATYLGGSGDEDGSAGGITVDALAMPTHRPTDSFDFPTTSGAFR